MLPRDSPAPSASSWANGWRASRALAGVHSHSSSASPRPATALQPRGRRTLATQLRVFLCGCGILYLALLWRSGLWTSMPSPSSVTTSMRAAVTSEAEAAIAQHHQRAARATHATSAPSATEEPPTVWTSVPSAAVGPAQPTPPVVHVVSTPVSRSELSTPTELAETARVSAVALASTVSATSTPTSLPPPTPTPTGMMDVEWLRGLLLMQNAAATPETRDSTVSISFEAHTARMHELEDKRLQALAVIGVLKNRLAKVLDKLQVHAAVIAEEDAKLVAVLPREYKKQPQQRKFKCLGWRATADCDPDGKRLPEGDRDCVDAVPAKAAGYCEIEDTATKERFRVMKTACDTLRWDAKLRCFDAWHFPNFAIQSHDVLRNATIQEERAVGAAAASPPKETTRGIVIVAYPKMLPSAYATLRTLRRLQCALAVELWYMTSEMENAEQHPIIEAMVTKYGPVRLRAIDDKTVKGFTTKIHAIRHSAFDQVLFLDADNVPVKDPTYLFELRQFTMAGALFWPDFWHPNHTIFAIHPRSLVWEYLDLEYVDMFEQESGQLVIDKTRCQKALALLDFYAHHEPNVLDKFKIVHGDKDLFRFAWLKSDTPFYMVDRPPAIVGNVLGGMFCGQTMGQYDPRGELLFLHRNAKKLEGRHPKAKPTRPPDPFSAKSPHGTLAATTKAEEEEEEEEEADPEIWTHLLQLKPTSTRANFTVEIYEASSDFPKGQWCYGKKSPAAPHFNTFRIADLAVRDVESEIRAYAIEATDLVRDANANTRRQEKVAAGASG